MEEQERIYTLIVKKKRVPVSKEVYKAYYKMKERERYQDELSVEHDLSFEACKENGIPIEYAFVRLQESIEDKIIKKEMLVKLMRCIKTLNSEEQLLIHELYFKSKSEQQIAVQVALPSRLSINEKLKYLPN